MGVSATWARRLLTEHRSGRPDPAQLRNAMLERLASEPGAAAYTKRKTTVEPVFGNLKANLGFRRFSRRGLNATTSEWRLICTVHNLLKIHRHRLATAWETTTVDASPAQIRQIPPLGPSKRQPLDRSFRFSTSRNVSQHLSLLAPPARPQQMTSLRLPVIADTGYSLDW